MALNGFFQTSTIRYRHYDHDDWDFTSSKLQKSQENSFKTCQTLLAIWSHIFGPMDSLDRAIDNMQS